MPPAEAPLQMRAPTPERWHTKPLDKRILDEKGEFVVKQQTWHTGELAYQTPAPPNELQARFGYQIVRVRRPTSYWEFYRKFPHFSPMHFTYQAIYALGVVALLVVLTWEVERLEQKPTGRYLVGDTLGKGTPGAKYKKYTESAQETQQRNEVSYEMWMNGKDLEYRGKNYHMQQIPRPKEFSVENLQGMGPWHGARGYGEDAKKRSDGLMNSVVVE